MAITYLLSWWYGQGWSWLLNSLADNMRSVKEIFSVSILFRTLLSPWKQIQTPSSFQNFFQSAVDNTMSRFIGAIIRSFMLLTAFFLTVGIVMFGLAALLIWPLLPFLVFLLPIASLVV
jgi:hypothetical protein